MFCKKCGTKIDDDSIFCCKCGARQSVEQAESSVDAPKPADEGTKIANTPSPSGVRPSQEEEPATGCGVALWCIIFFFVVLALVGVLVMADWSGGIGCGSRQATTSDISVDTDLNIMALGIDVVVTPKEDISGLELTLVYCDNVGKELKTQKLYIGDVKDGVKTKKTVAITEFSLTEALQISSVKIRVSGGTVD